MLVCLGLAGVVLLIYGQTTGHDFVNYDDGTYVYENDHVKAGLTADGLVWALTYSHASNWHPITWMSHMFDWELYGAWAGGHHLTSAVLHAAAAVVLFLALTRLTGDPGAAAAVAALWAVHPLRVESVAWVAERKDVLSGLFFALCLLGYARYVERPTWGRYVAVAAALALGLMAKAMLVTLPCLLLLLDYWPLGRWRSAADFWPLFREKLPLFALAAAASAVTVATQQSGMTSVATLPLEARIGNAAVAAVIYLRQFVYPAALAPFYPHPNFWGGGGHSVIVVLACAATLAVITVVAVVFRRRAPWLAVGWFWYLGMLVPVVGLVQVGSQANADRYTYLPQVGLLIAVVWGVRSVCGARLARPAALAAGLALAAVALVQVSHWRDGVTLFRHAIACTPPNPVAYHNLGAELARRGNGDEAVELLRKSLELDPNGWASRDALVGVYTNRGIESARAGRTREAKELFDIALGIDSNHLEARRNLAVLHLNSGLAEARAGRIPEAVNAFRHATEADPSFALAHNNLGVALRDSGRLEEAATCFRRAIELDPGDRRARANLDGLVERKRP